MKNRIVDFMMKVGGILLGVAIAISVVNWISTQTQSSVPDISLRGVVVTVVPIPRITVTPTLQTKLRHGYIEQEAMARALGTSVMKGSCKDRPETAYAPADYSNSFCFEWHVVDIPVAEYIFDDTYVGPEWVAGVYLDPETDDVQHYIYCTDKVWNFEPIVPSTVEQHITKVQFEILRDLGIQTYYPAGHSEICR